MANTRVYIYDPTIAQVRPIASGDTPVDGSNNSLATDSGALLDADFAGSATGRMTRTGSGTYAVKKDNLAGAADPVGTDDSASGYGAGSLWLNATGKRLFVANTVGVGAAEWIPLGDYAVTAAEYAYIATLTSNAQTQLDAKAPAASPTLTGTVTLADGSTLLRKGAGTGTGDVIEVIGLTVNEGLELRVFEETISPAAVETNVVNLPAGSIPIAVLGNVESALTGGGTTATWSLGTTGDPDKYGTAGFPSQADSLAKNSKSRFLGPFTQLTSAEQIVLSGAATGGAADGDTALTVGSVRVRVIYWTCNDLDDAP